MTDFLIRLAQRTLGLAPVVQPRIASLYAPTADVMTIDNVYNLSANTGSISPLPAESTQTLHSTTSASPLAAMEEPFPSLAPLPHTEKKPPPVAPETVIQGAPPSNLSMGDHASITSTQRFLERPLPFRPANSSKNKGESFPLLLPQKLVSPTALPTDERPKPQSLNPSSDVGGTASSFATPFLKQPEQPPQASVVQLPLVPLTVPQSASQPLIHHQAGDQDVPLVPMPSSVGSSQTFLVSASSAIAQPINQSEPSITIRIGRVEVRGIQPAATTQTRPKAPLPTPALSLSDYLNQREGGKP